MDDELAGAHGAARIAGGASNPEQNGDSASITFDGRAVPAFVGEPLIAALIAAGVRVFRTMPRTGEPRGGFCLVGRCSDCMVVVDGVPNCRACLIPVRGGMHVETQHGVGTWMASPS